MYSFIYFFIYSFIYSFIHLFISSVNIYDFKAVEFSKIACAFQDDEVKHIFFPYFSVLAALRADASFL